MRRLLLALTLMLLPACGSGHKTLASDPPTSLGPVRPGSGGGDADQEDITEVSPGLNCGYERWSVKTGTDPLAGQVNLTSRASSIAALRKTKSPFPLVTSKFPPQYKRQPQEMSTVTVKARILRYSSQQDGDIHIVIGDSAGETMIAEIPNPQCVKGGPFLFTISAARQAFLAKTGYVPPVIPKGQYSPKFVAANPPIDAHIYGVVFYDVVHGQNGVASNGVEIHPILGLTFP